jgi:hypothetical protein
MKKIISLSITLFCFTSFIQSCEPEKSSTPKPTLATVIYSEETFFPSGEKFCEGHVCISPEIATNLPLEFTNKHRDGNTTRLKFAYFKFSNDQYQPIPFPEGATALRPYRLPQSPDEKLFLAPTTPIQLKCIRFKALPSKISAALPS